MLLLNFQLWGRSQFEQIKGFPQLLSLISSKFFFVCDSYQAKLQYAFNSILTGEHHIWLNTHTKDLHLAGILYE